MTSSHQSLSLFLSYRGSLSRWQQEGILSREIAIYLLHIQNGIFDNISIFSYCRADNALIQENAETDSRYRAINIIAPPHWLSGKTFLWSLIGPFIFRAKLAKSAVLKTNQISGSWSAIIARLLTDRPLLLRMGYSLSRRFRKNGDSFRSFIANIVESTGFRVAAHILVNNQQMVAQIQTKGHGSKMSLLPTYVDINQFSEKPGHDFKKPLVTVGRLCPQKNLANLIRACAIIQRRLVIYGDGPLYVELKQVAMQARQSFAMLALAEAVKYSVGLGLFIFMIEAGHSVEQAMLAQFCAIAGFHILYFSIAFRSLQISSIFSAGFRKALTSRASRQARIYSYPMTQRSSSRS